METKFLACTHEEQEICKSKWLSFCLGSILVKHNKSMTNWFSAIYTSKRWSRNHEQDPEVVKKATYTWKHKNATWN